VDSTRLGPYVALREIGRGGSSVVYEARRDDEPTRVALKVGAVSADDAEARSSRKRFLDEAARLSRVDHPAVVRVLAAGELPDGAPFIAMELCEGESLAARLARGPLALDEAMRLFEAVAHGLQALHDEGLLHRDVKPENVMLVRSAPELLAGEHSVAGLPTPTDVADTRPVLIDLGIAKDTRAPASTTTQTGIVRGTPASMAPERFFGQGATVATDVYEAALLLYVMIAGRPPWEDGADVDQRLDAKPLAEVADVPSSLSDVVMRALAVRSARRPQSIRALLEELTAARSAIGERRETTEIATRPSDGRTAPPPQVPQPRLASGGLGRIVVGSLIGLAGVGIGLAVASARDTSTAVDATTLPSAAPAASVEQTADAAESRPAAERLNEPSAQAPTPTALPATSTTTSASGTASPQARSTATAKLLPPPKACVELDDFLCATKGPTICAKARENTQETAAMRTSPEARDIWARGCRMTHMELQSEIWKVDDRLKNDARRRVEAPPPN
jgi:serine/threonine-protein kinase